MDETTAEEWRPVPGYEGTYEVSSLGRVYSHHPHARTGRHGGILKTWVKTLGYRYVTLYSGTDRRSRKVHHLVLEAFVGPRPEGLVARHLNGDDTDARLSNLAYGTQSENVQDTLRHGRHKEARKTICLHGHAFSPENTYVTGKGKRICKACERRKNAEGYRRRRARLLGRVMAG